MRHSHKLEKKQYDSIRDYIQEYNSKVKSLGELKSLVNNKFGNEYNNNQISYFKGKWQGDAINIDKEANSETECANLVRMLKKNSSNDGDFFELEYDANEKNYLSFLFYSTGRMKETFLKTSGDLVFINKRFSQNRFKRPLLMFFTVSNTGKS